jgi:hypothetical protein
MSPYGVDQGNAEIDGTIEGGDGLRFVAGAIEGAHPHRPEALDRHPQVLAAEFDRLHRVPACFPRILR